MWMIKDFNSNKFPKFGFTVEPVKRIGSQYTFLSEKGD